MTDSRSSTGISNSTEMTRLLRERKQQQPSNKQKSIPLSEYIEIIAEINENSDFNISNFTPEQKEAAVNFLKVVQQAIHWSEPPDKERSKLVQAAQNVIDILQGKDTGEIALNDLDSQKLKASDKPLKSMTALLFFFIFLSVAAMIAINASTMGMLLMPSLAVTLKILIISVPFAASMIGGAVVSKQHDKLNNSLSTSKAAFIAKFGNNQEQAGGYGSTAMRQDYSVTA